FSASNSSVLPFVPGVTVGTSLLFSSSLVVSVPLPPNHPDPLPNRKYHAATRSTSNKIIQPSGELLSSTSRVSRTSLSTITVRSSSISAMSLTLLLLHLGYVTLYWLAGGKAVIYVTFKNLTIK